MWLVEHGWQTPKSTSVVRLSVVQPLNVLSGWRCERSPMLAMPYSSRLYGRVGPGGGAMMMVVMVVMMMIGKSKE